VVAVAAAKWVVVAIVGVILQSLVHRIQASEFSVRWSASTLQYKEL
jgi:hypothetical protein